MFTKSENPVNDGKTASAAKAAIPQSKPPRIGLDLVEVDNGFNPRNFDDPKNVKRIEELAESIKSQGVLVPILVRHSGKKVFLVSGETRLRACKLLRSQGHPLHDIPYTSEMAGTSDKDRLITVLATNNGVKPLEPLERAEAISRLVKMGLTEKEVAVRAGLSQASISNALILNSAPESAKEMIRAEKVAPSEVIEAVRSNREEVVKTLEAAQEIAEEQSGTGAKIEKRHVRAASAGNASPTSKINGKLAKESLSLCYALLDYDGDSVKTLQQWVCDFLEEHNLPLEPEEPKVRGRKPAPAAEAGTHKKKLAKCLSEILSN